MCVRLCWLPEACVPKVTEHNLSALPEGRLQEAVMWFYDSYGVSGASANKATGLMELHMSIDDFYEAALTLYDMYQTSLLRAQHADLQDEYRRYQTLLMLIASLGSPDKNSVDS